jgi:hypothetical protein
VLIADICEGCGAIFESTIANRDVRAFHAMWRAEHAACLPPARAAA